MSGMVWSRGLALSNVSFGMLYVIYLSVIGGSTLPFKLLLPKFNISLLVGGYLGSLALEKVASNLEIS